jgi:MIP family channel proteins
MKFLAEFAGTFAMVFAGTGSIVLNDLSHGRIGNIGIGLAFGLSVFAMVSLLGSISGAQINPAVTMTLWIARRIQTGVALAYIGFQFAGAIVASLLLSLLFPQHPTLGATLPRGSELQSFALEFLLSFILLFAILMLLMYPPKRRMISPILIGLLIALEATFGGPISGASMNPARSLAPAIVSRHLEHLWIYLTAPVIGGVFAIPVSKMFARLFTTHGIVSKTFPEVIDPETASKAFPISESENCL